MASGVKNDVQSRVSFQSLLNGGVGQLYHMAQKQEAAPQAKGAQADSYSAADAQSSKFAALTGSSSRASGPADVPLRGFRSLLARDVG